MLSQSSSHRHHDASSEKKKNLTKKEKNKQDLPAIVSFARSSSKRIKKRVSPPVSSSPCVMKNPHLHDDPKKVSSFPFLPSSQTASALWYRCRETSP
jgi:hypothetical protein